MISWCTRVWLYTNPHIHTPSFVCLQQYRMIYYSYWWLLYEIPLAFDPPRWKRAAPSWVFSIARSICCACFVVVGAVSFGCGFRGNGCERPCVYTAVAVRLLRYGALPPSVKSTLVYSSKSYLISWILYSSYSSSSKSNIISWLYFSSCFLHHDFKTLLWDEKIIFKKKIVYELAFDEKYL